MNPRILFEDDDLLVIDKPSGLTVNRAETTKNQETVQDFLISNDKFLISNKNPNDKNEQEFNSKVGIVHRLDKDASGVLVVAKNLESYLKLKAQFQNREAVKKYLALVHGIVEPKEGVINAPIARSPFNRTRFGVFPGGREATTRYRVISNFIRRTGGSNYSLLEVFPKTGRTHQIRVHMKYINYPIVSDPIYGGRKQYRDDLKFCPRLFLHATSLEILGKVFESPLPEELQKVLNLIDVS